MTAHPMSFADVLQDEYRYFFGEVSLHDRPLQFEREHVRELDDFANKLLLARKQKQVQSRWRFLGERAFDDQDEVAQSSKVLAALNEMLTRKELLGSLLATDPSIARELAARGPLHGLLAIPGARRLLLQEQAMRDAIRNDDGVLPRFKSRSAAIRLLVDEKMTDLLLEYPALLSSIADDERVEKALAGSAAMRGRLPKLFNPVAPPPWYSPARWFGSAPPRDEEARGLHQLAANPDQLLEMLGVLDHPPVSEPIPPGALSHFNALIIETVYSDYVGDGVTMRELYDALYRKQMSALCLSGGGIRSATFNLGILQGLADHRVLNRFNYISTVSGGGYIGSWLSSWIRRHNEGAIGVAEDLVREPVDPLEPEVKPIRHLREYSSYLAPQSSAFSVDTWTLLATYLRNLLLNWTMLIPFLAAVLAVPRLMEALVMIGRRGAGTGTALAAIAAALLAVAMVGFVRPKSDVTAKKRSVDRTPLRDQYNRYLLWLAPLFVSAVLFSLCWASPDTTFSSSPLTLPLLFGAGSLMSAVVHVAMRARAMAAGGTSRWQKFKNTLRALVRWKQQGKRLLLECLAAGVSGAVGGALLYLAFSTVFPRDVLNKGLWFEAYVCTSVPLYFLVFFLDATLLVGFTTQSSSDHDREWWARSAATMFLVGTGIAALSFVVIVLPVLILQLPQFLVPVGGVSGALSWLLQQKLKNSKPKSEKSALPLMTMLHIAATITMAFVLAGIAIGSSYLLNLFIPAFATSDRLSSVFGSKVLETTALFMRVLRASGWLLITSFIGAATLIAGLMSRLLDVNLYSMHAMYRNRLVRAYLGASRWSRNPDAFTGFDPQDDIRMADLRPEALWPSCIVNFDEFLAKLDATKPLLRQLPADVQDRVKGYVKTPKSDDRESLKAAVVNALNELMPVRDLEHDVDSDPSLDLFLTNRSYLDRCFDGAIKRFDEKGNLPATENVIAPLASNEDDDAITHAIKSELSDNSRAEVRGRPPLHIVNAALNLVGGTNLAWQERKAASFTISPLHSGSRLLCYRDSAVYGGGVTLGTALAISGAAVSPNMGSMSSPTFTFLMTLFNARLGWWLGNPAKNRYEKVTPGSSITSLLREAGGKTDETHPFVFLSDGGHFENLGVYEMVARRCKYIVVCDATADGEYAFGDLANAVRKIRIDMGIPVERMTTRYIRPEAGEKHGKYCAMGEIKYGPGARGYLLYIKPSLREDCPADVRNYGRESTSFPHESTIDQFFSESQFESYRQLGRHILGAICDTGEHKDPWVSPNVAAFFGKAYAYINKLEPGIGDRPVKTMKDVVGWMSDGI